MTEPRHDRMLIARLLTVCVLLSICEVGPIPAFAQTWNAKLPPRQPIECRSHTILNSPTMTDGLAGLEVMDLRADSRIITKSNLFLQYSMAMT